MSGGPGSGPGFDLDGAGMSTDGERAAYLRGHDTAVKACAVEMAIHRVDVRDWKLKAEAADRAYRPLLVRVQEFDTRLLALEAKHKKLKAAAVWADNNLTCEADSCWCFTRAAMKPNACTCANCEAWQRLRDALKD